MCMFLLVLLSLPLGWLLGDMAGSKCAPLAARDDWRFLFGLIMWAAVLIAIPAEFKPVADYGGAAWFLGFLLGPMLKPPSNGGENAAA